MKIKERNFKMQMEEYIKNNEGCRLTPYQDTLGNWTIGWGHRIRSDEFEHLKNNITQEQADKLFSEDLRKVLRGGTYRNFTNQPASVKIVIADMIYNMGAARFGQFRNFIKEIKNKNYKKVANEILYNGDKKTPYYKQTKKRAERNAEIIKGG